MAGDTRGPAPKWTAERDAELRRLWEDEGLTSEAVAARMGFKHRSTVNSRLRVLGLRARRAARPAEVTSTDWSEADLERLRTLWADGLTATAIGKAMGRSKSAILGKAHRLMLPPRRDGINPETAHRRRPSGAPKAKPAPRRAANGAPARIARKAARYGNAGVEAGAPGFAALRAGPPKLPSLFLLETPEPDSALAVPFAERASSQCCWPLWRGEPPIGERLVCGAPVEPGHGHPYCAHHLARSAQAPRMATTAQAEERTAA